MGPNVNSVFGDSSSIPRLMMLEKNLVPPVLSASSHYQLIGLEIQSLLKSIVRSNLLYQCRCAAYNPPDMRGSKAVIKYTMCFFPSFSGTTLVKVYLASLIWLLTRDKTCALSRQHMGFVTYQHEKLYHCSLTAARKLERSGWRSLSLPISAFLEQQGI